MCFWNHRPVGTPNCTQEPNAWLMILGFPEEFGNNPPSTLFHLLSLGHRIHLQQNSPTAWYYHHHV